MTDKALTAIAVVGGAAAVGIGVWFFMKKPPGVSPGEIIEANVTFDYLGAGSSYEVLVRFGYHHLAFWFDPEEGLDNYYQGIVLTGPDHYEFPIECDIPAGAKPHTYDAEISILTPGMVHGQEWIIRAFVDKAITVREA